MKKIVFFFLLWMIPFFVWADTGHSMVVMEMTSGRILYSKNASKSHLIASTTKIMTCLIVLENVDIHQNITVGEEVLSMYGTNIYLEKGEVLSIKDLLYGLMLRSGNDAAEVLAVQTFGEEQFVQKMNEKAKELGMKNTIFENPHGLDESTKNYSTAYDMALLSQYAYQNKTYREIISTKKYVTKSNLKSYVWYNRMSLLNQYEYCVGGKNGYTPKAGKSLVSYAKKKDMILTIVSLDDDSIYENHKKLYEKYFSLYSLYTIVDSNQFSIDESFTSHLVYLKKSFNYPLTEEEKDRITTLVSLYPTMQDYKVGKITVYLDHKEIGNLSIYEKKKQKKEEISFFQKIIDLVIRKSKKVNGWSTE